MRPAGRTSIHKAAGIGLAGKQEEEFSAIVRRTHEKVRTLTCLFAEFSLASRLEQLNSDDQQATVTERPLLPLSY